MKKLILYMIILLCCLCSVLASEPFYYENNSSIDIKINCLVDERLCDVNVSCNLTVLYPNSSVLIDFKPMSYNSGYYNYTITDTVLNGLYQTSVICCDTINQTCNIVNFGIVINDDGIKPVEKGFTWDLLIIFGLWMFLLILTIVFLTSPFGLIFGVSSCFIGVFLAILLIDVNIWVAYIFGFLQLAMILMFYLMIKD